MIPMPVTTVVRTRESGCSGSWGPPEERERSRTLGREPQSSTVEARTFLVVTTTVKRTTGERQRKADLASSARNRTKDTRSLDPTAEMLHRRVPRTPFRLHGFPHRHVAGETSTENGGFANSITVRAQRIAL